MKLASLRPILCLASLVYYTVIITRNFLYNIGFLKSSLSSIPTICIGNISVGGTGKTPLVCHIAKIKSESHKVGILTRGYGGTLDKTSPYLARSEDQAEKIGDEAKLYQVLLNENSPLLIISPDRVAGNMALKEAGAELCIMDDGLQHLAIKPTMRICLIDVADISSYYNQGTCSLLPAGIFREPVKQAISRTDWITFTSKCEITTEGFQTIEKLASYLKIKSYSVIEFKPSTIRDGYSGEIRQIEPDRSYSLTTSIAKPEPLTKSYLELGARIIDKAIFPDHYAYSLEDWKKISGKNTVLSSAKDWVKLKPYLTENHQLYFIEQEVIDLSSENNRLLDVINRMLTIS